MFSILQLVVLGMIPWFNPALAVMQARPLLPTFDRPAGQTAPVAATEDGSAPPVVVDPPPATTAPTGGSAPPAPADLRPEIVLLDALERSAHDLRTFTAAVTFETEDSILEEVTRRFGQLVYAVEPGTDGRPRPRRAIAITFERQLEGGRMRERRKHYVFRDRFLAEIDPEQKLFVKREIAPPGSDFDPLKLGEGPFPLPVGQTRAEVLRRFDPSLLDLPAQGLLAKLATAPPVDGLRLVPRPGSAAARDIVRVDLFYDRATRLPVGIELLEKGGDRKTVLLRDLRRNVELDPATRARLEIVTPEAGTGWRIDVRPYSATGG